MGEGAWTKEKRKEVEEVETKRGHPGRKLKEKQKNQCH